MTDWSSGGKRWRRGRRIKQKDICHFPELVILHSLLFMWMMGWERYYLLFFFVCFCLHFSRGGRTSSSTCCYGFVCERGKSRLVDGLDKLLWTTVEYRPSSSSSTFVPPPSRLGATTSVQTGDLGATVPAAQLVQRDMDLFTVSLHTAAVFMAIDTLAASLSAVFPTQPTTTHIR